MPRKAKEQSESVKELATQSDAHVQNNSKSQGNNMSDEIGSIIEYQEDISNAEAPKPIPVGDYTAEIRSAEIKEGPKAKYIAVQFFIPADEYPADFTDGNPDGTPLTYMRLSPNQDQRSKYNMRKFCEAIGAPLGNRIDLTDWIGKNAVLNIAHSPYEGVMQANIKAVKPV